MGGVLASTTVLPGARPRARGALFSAASSPREFAGCLLVHVREVLRVREGAELFGCAIASPHGMHHDLSPPAGQRSLEDRSVCAGCNFEETGAADELERALRALAPRA